MRIRPIIFKTRDKKKVNYTTWHKKEMNASKANQIIKIIDGKERTGMSMLTADVKCICGKERNFTAKDMGKYGKIMFDMGRDVERKKNKKIIRWLKGIIEWNAHDKAWIEQTIEKLKENK
jgi:hypothetical protein